MTSYTGNLRDMAKQWKTAQMNLLKMLLDLHVTCVNGVTAREAAGWMNLPKGKSSETSIGKMLKELGYRRYRRYTTTGREVRLFPEGKASEGWTL